MIAPVWRDVAGARGRDRPSVAILAVDADRHALLGLVDRDHDIRTRVAGSDARQREQEHDIPHGGNRPPDSGHILRQYAEELRDFEAAPAISRTERLTAVC
jgi:hypothetical protein